MTPVEGSTNKRLWYRTWWGVIIALIFLPLFIFWWVWKRTDLKPNLRKSLLVAAGGFALMVYGVTGFALADMPGTPLVNVPRSTSSQAVSISGSNVDPNNNVTLLLNDSEYKTTQATSDGKFTFDNVALNEGGNSVKAFAIRANGKRKESAKYTITYNKPQEAPKPIKTSEKEQETPAPQTNAPQTQTEPPVEQVQPEVVATAAPAPKEPTTLDKLWTVLDQSIKTRDGFDIQYFTKYFENSDVERRDNNQVFVTIQPKDYLNETTMMKIAYQQFIQFGLKAFQIDGVDEIEFLYWNNFTDQYGKSDKWKAINFSMLKSEFSQYEWPNLVGQNIYNQMRNSCKYYYVNPAVEKNLKVEKLTLLAL